MIAALITDYERALLDTLRTDARMRSIVDGLAMLPATAEAEAHTREIYNNEWRRKHGKDRIPEAEAAAELAHHERIQEDFRFSYKARGYKPPYTYGKGRVKVLFERIEGGTQAEAGEAAEDREQVKRDGEQAEALREDFTQLYKIRHIGN